MNQEAITSAQPTKAPDVETASIASSTRRHRRGMSGITPRELKYIDSAIPLPLRQRWKQFSARPITTKESFEENFVHHVETTLARSLFNCDTLAAYLSAAQSVRNTLIIKWNRTQQKQTIVNKKRVYYLSLEWLMGRALDNALVNLGIKPQVADGLEDFGFNIEDVIEREPDAGLGNGGLGRLAACFIDSLTTGEYPAWGYGLRYEYGIFKQKIVDGYQVEYPDAWLAHGDPWDIARHELTVDIMFYGDVEDAVDDNGKRYRKWTGGDLVVARAHDMPIPGYKTENVNNLRLWVATSSNQFDFSAFNEGNYKDAVDEQVDASTITSVLYPNDNFNAGKELRLKQQYLWVAASLNDIVRRFKKSKVSWSRFPDLVAIQLNDTHPSLAIVELLRILTDIEKLEWVEAWEIVTQTFSYTNHTVLPEALEKWSVDILGHLLPRHLELIYQINYDFLREVKEKFPGNFALLRDVSLIEETQPKQVRMAYLAIVGSHKVNGVAELHSELIQTSIFSNFVKVYGAEKFINITNGITPRRWLLESNPRLADLIAHKIGGYDYLKHLNKLELVEKFIHDTEFRTSWQDIKRSNKKRLVHLLESQAGTKLDINLDSLFDIQVKRIHEYKRQQLNIFGVIYRYLVLKALPANERATVQSRVVVFGGKSAPGYYMAKVIIHLINTVSAVVNADPETNSYLQVYFIADYNVSKAQVIAAASDISEHISTAGTEASGTSNMKFVLNGGLLIGTVDGANIEIGREVGQENVFFFGHLSESVEQVRNETRVNGVHLNPRLERVFEAIDEGQFGYPEKFRSLLDSVRHNDYYLVNADFDSYIETQAVIDTAYADQQEWTTRIIHCVANMGFFSSDRAVKEYADTVWNAQPVPVEESDPYSVGTVETSTPQKSTHEKVSEGTHVFGGYNSPPTTFGTDTASYGSVLSAASRNFGDVGKSSYDYKNVFGSDSNTTDKSHVHRSTQLDSTSNLEDQSSPYDSADDGEESKGILGSVAAAAATGAAALGLTSEHKHRETDTVASISGTQSDHDYTATLDSERDPSGVKYTSGHGHLQTGKGVEGTKAYKDDHFAAASGAGKGLSSENYDDRYGKHTGTEGSSYSHDGKGVEGTRASSSGTGKGLSSENYNDRYGKHTGTEGLSYSHHGKGVEGTKAYKDDHFAASSETGKGLSSENYDDRFGKHTGAESSSYSHHLGGSHLHRSTQLDSTSNLEDQSSPYDSADDGEESKGILGSVAAAAATGAAALGLTSEHKHRGTDPASISGTQSDHDYTATLDSERDPSGVRYTSGHGHLQTGKGVEGTKAYKDDHFAATSGAGKGLSSGDYDDRYGKHTGTEGSSYSNHGKGVEGTKAYKDNHFAASSGTGKDLSSENYDDRFGKHTGTEGSSYSHHLGSFESTSETRQLGTGTSSRASKETTNVYQNVPFGDDRYDKHSGIGHSSGIAATTGESNTRDTNTSTYVVSPARFKAHDQHGSKSDPGQSTQFDTSRNLGNASTQEPEWFDTIEEEVKTALGTVAAAAASGAAALGLSRGTATDEASTDGGPSKLSQTYPTTQKDVSDQVSRHAIDRGTTSGYDRQPTDRDVGGTKIYKDVCTKPVDSDDEFRGTSTVSDRKIPEQEGQSYTSKFNLQGHPKDATLAGDAKPSVSHTSGIASNTPSRDIKTSIGNSDGVRSGDAYTTSKHASDHSQKATGIDNNTKFYKDERFDDRSEGITGSKVHDDRYGKHIGTESSSYDHQTRSDLASNTLPDYEDEHFDDAQEGESRGVLGAVAAAAATGAAALGLSSKTDSVSQDKEKGNDQSNLHGQYAYSDNYKTSKNFTDKPFDGAKGQFDSTKDTNPASSRETGGVQHNHEQSSPRQTNKTSGYACATNGNRQQGDESTLAKDAPAPLGRSVGQSNAHTSSNDTTEHVGEAHVPGATTGRPNVPSSIGGTSGFPVVSGAAERASGARGDVAASLGATAAALAATQAASPIIGLGSSGGTSPSNVRSTKPIVVYHSDREHHNSSHKISGHDQSEQSGSPRRGSSREAKYKDAGARTGDNDTTYRGLGKQQDETLDPRSAQISSGDAKFKDAGDRTHDYDTRYHDVGLQSEELNSASHASSRETKYKDAIGDKTQGYDTTYHGVGHQTGVADPAATYGSTRDTKYKGSSSTGDEAQGYDTTYHGVGHEAEAINPTAIYGSTRDPKYKGSSGTGHKTQGYDTTYHGVGHQAEVVDPPATYGSTRDPKYKGSSGTGDKTQGYDTTYHGVAHQAEVVDPTATYGSTRDPKYKGSSGTGDKTQGYDTTYHGVAHQAEVVDPTATYGSTRDPKYKGSSGTGDKTQGYDTTYQGVGHEAEAINPTAIYGSTRDPKYKGSSGTGDKTQGYDTTYHGVGHQAEVVDPTATYGSTRDPKYKGSSGTGDKTQGYDTTYQGVGHEAEAINPTAIYGSTRDPKYKGSSGTGDKTQGYDTTYHGVAHQTEVVDPTATYGSTRDPKYKGSSGTGDKTQGYDTTSCGVGHQAGVVDPSTAYDHTKYKDAIGGYDTNEGTSSYLGTRSTSGSNRNTAQSTENTRSQYGSKSGHQSSTTSVVPADDARLKELGVDPEEADRLTGKALKPPIHEGETVTIVKQKFASGATDASKAPEHTTTFVNSRGPRSDARGATSGTKKASNNTGTLTADDPRLKEFGLHPEETRRHLEKDPKFHELQSDTGARSREHQTAGAPSGTQTSSYGQNAYSTTGHTSYGQDTVGTAVQTSARSGHGIDGGQDIYGTGDQTSYSKGTLGTRVHGAHDHGVLGSNTYGTKVQSGNGATARGITKQATDYNQNTIHQPTGSGQSPDSKGQATGYDHEIQETRPLRKSGATTGADILAPDDSRLSDFSLRLEETGRSTENDPKFSQLQGAEGEKHSSGATGIGSDSADHQRSGYNQGAPSASQARRGTTGILTADDPKLKEFGLRTGETTHGQKRSSIAVGTGSDSTTGQRSGHGSNRDSFVEYGVHSHRGGAESRSSSSRDTTGAKGYGNDYVATSQANMSKEAALRAHSAHGGQKGASRGSSALSGTSGLAAGTVAGTGATAAARSVLGDRHRQSVDAPHTPMNSSPSGASNLAAAQASGGAAGTKSGQRQSANDKGKAASGNQLGQPDTAATGGRPSPRTPTTRTSASQESHGHRSPAADPRAQTAIPQGFVTKQPLRTSSDKPSHTNMASTGDYRSAGERALHSAGIDGDRTAYAQPQAAQGQHDGYETRNTRGDNRSTISPISSKNQHGEQEGITGEITGAVLGAAGAVAAALGLNGHEHAQQQGHQSKATDTGYSGTTTGTGYGHSGSAAGTGYGHSDSATGAGYSSGTTSGTTAGTGYGHSGSATSAGYPSGTTAGTTASTGYGHSGSAAGAGVPTGAAAGTTGGQSSSGYGHDEFNNRIREARAATTESDPTSGYGSNTYGTRGTSGQAGDTYGSTQGSHYGGAALAAGAGTAAALAGGAAASTHGQPASRAGDVGTGTGYGSGTTGTGYGSGTAGTGYGSGTTGTGYGSSATGTSSGYGSDPKGTTYGSDSYGSSGATGTGYGSGTTGTGYGSGTTGTGYGSGTTGTGTGHGTTTGTSTGHSSDPKGTTYGSDNYGSSDPKGTGYGSGATGASYGSDPRGTTYASDSYGSSDPKGTGYSSGATGASGSYASEPKGTSAGSAPAGTHGSTSAPKGTTTTGYGSSATGTSAGYGSDPKGVSSTSASAPSGSYGSDPRTTGYDSGVTGTSGGYGSEPKGTTASTSTPAGSYGYDSRGTGHDTGATGTSAGYGSDPKGVSSTSAPSGSYGSDSRGTGYDSGVAGTSGGYGSDAVPSGTAGTYGTDTKGASYGSGAAGAAGAGSYGTDPKTSRYDSGTTEPKGAGYGTSPTGASGAVGSGYGSGASSQPTATQAGAGGPGAAKSGSGYDSTTGTAGTKSGQPGIGHSAAAAGAGVAGVGAAGVCATGLAGKGADEVGPSADGHGFTNADGQKVAAPEEVKQQAQKAANQGKDAAKKASDNKGAPGKGDKPADGSAEKKKGFCKCF